MEVTYTSTRADVAAFHRDWARYKSTPEAQKQYFSRWFLWFPIGLALVALALGVRSVWAFPLPAVLGMGAQRLVSFWHKRYSVNWLAKMPGVIGPAATRLDSDGVYHRDTFAEWKVFWASVTDVVLTAEFVLVFTQRDSHIWVPRRAFDTENERQEFYNMAVAHWKAANVSAVP